MKMKKSVLVVLSGGQDSTTCLHWALSRFEEVHAVTFDYGQRHRLEVEAAKEIGKKAGVKSHTLLPLDVLKAIGDSALIEGSQTPLQGEGGRADTAMPQGLPTSFVPGRNLLFLSAAGALAVKLGCETLVTGVCQTDYSGYPDCREEFIKALEVALCLAMPSSSPIRIETPLMHLSKKESVELAVSLEGCLESLALSVTCYNGLRPGCGTCPACVLRAKGFEEAGIPDPQNNLQS